jgi:hypothetical protein
VGFTVKQLAYMLAHNFDRFLACFLEELYEIAEQHEL